MKYLLTLLLLSVSCLGAEINPKFFKAMHQVETSGRYGAVWGDNGRSLGPFQISQGYWKDATAFDKSIGGKWSDCANYNYSVKVVTAWMRRYMPKSLKAKHYENMARAHNGGPSGWKRLSTIQYWKKFKRELDKTGLKH